MEGGSAPTGNADSAVVRFAYEIVFFAGVVGVLLAITDVLDISVIVNTEEFQWFALLYIAAQAIERFLEPIMNRKDATETAGAKQAVSTAKQELALAGESQAETGAADVTTKAATVTSAQARLDTLQANRAVTAWAYASGIALVLCGALDLGIIKSIATVETTSGLGEDVFQAIDVVVTGLVIGAGTKPLHDLITRVERSKNNADPATQPPATTTQAPAAGVGA